MKLQRIFHLFVAAASAAFVSSATAQVITVQNFQSQSGYGGSTTTFNDSATKTQVFTDVLAVTSLTYNFFAGSGGGGATTGTTLAATFGEWNGSSIVNALDLGQFTIGASNTAGWTNTLSYVNEANQTVVTGNYLNASHTFDFTDGDLNLDPTYGFLSDPTKSYALTLSWISGDKNLALGANVNSSFTNGYQTPFNPALLGASFNGYDYVFSQISVAPNPVIPEASTVASILSACFVAGLVGYRLRQRQLATATAHAVTATA